MCSLMTVRRRSTTRWTRRLVCGFRWKYWKASGDDEGAKQLLPALRDVVKYYKEGTRFDIRADSDGLITAGTLGSQLTWMDVKVDGYVPTPRHGKPVEINALWLNALLMLAEMEEKLGQNVHAAVICASSPTRLRGVSSRRFGSRTAIIFMM